MKTLCPAARRLLLPALSLSLLGGGSLLAVNAARTPLAHAASADPAALARQAISENRNTARAAVAALRAQGPAGYRALLSAYDAQTRRGDDGGPRWRRISAALDGVSRQKDSHASRLFWYTDLAEAKRAAKASGKPILSLRLLGHLDEEISCANSRFFRTTLYPDAAVSAYLRDHYVLHWSSERPVPVFTLDFGDGRKVVRTLTGNSIHYVLDAEGRPVDAVPGLYGPKAFLRALAGAEPLAREMAAVQDPRARQERLQRWHRERLLELSEAWRADCAKAYGQQARSVPDLVRLIENVGRPRPGTPGALEAAPLAVGKGAGELPVVQALSSGGSWAVGTSTLEWAWDQIGKLHAEDARLDANCRALIAAKKPDLSRVPAAQQVSGPQFRLVSFEAERPAAAAPPPVAPPDRAMDALVSHFERAMAQDTARNEYVFHAKLHQWFANGRATGDLSALNERVYADLFLTPSEDPWLGLAPGGAYVALPNDGLIGEPKKDDVARTARR